LGSVKTIDQITDPVDYFGTRVVITLLLPPPRAHSKVLRAVPSFKSDKYAGSNLHYSNQLRCCSAHALPRALQPSKLRPRDTRNMRQLHRRDIYMATLLSAGHGLHRFSCCAEMHQSSPTSVDLVNVEEQGGGVAQRYKDHPCTRARTRKRTLNWHAHTQKQTWLCTRNS
jgi:hypothetical protein